ncbi:hypothetical protein [Streptomyces cadmiisoli]|uniref:Uncharacterized protein n=1 Tax=Streptomyces cadmiisoli TaxID=2184053 RepID=A0A2Z4J6M0_9ACTN|nr:hypothetical protein [Streptomyces cadmiisoli]AWW40771.1 hypothetical protein DN051_32245 [Streptomyces cadmiisoli]
MTENTLKDPAKNIMVKGEEVPRVIDNGDGTVTWNLKGETATRIAALLLISLAGTMPGSRRAPSGGFGDFLTGRGL